MESSKKSYNLENLKASDLSPLLKEIPEAIYHVDMLMTALETGSIPTSAAVHLVNLEKSIEIIRKNMKLIPQNDFKPFD